jgi:hypothetical protein
MGSAAANPSPAIAVGEPNPSAPAPGSDAGAATPLVVPDAYRKRYAAAMHQGIEDARTFRERHDPSQHWLIGQWAVLKLGFPPRTDDVDLKELHALQDQRTPEGIARARYWDKHGLEDAWQKYLDEYKAKATPQQAREAQALFDDTLMQVNQATTITKSGSLRTRPYLVDSTLQLAVDKPGNNPSYPSGHTSAAIGAALVLAHLMPDRKAEFMNLATEASFARVYAGVHFPTDVMAGAQLASTVAAYVMRVQKTTPIDGTRTGAATSSGGGFKGTLPMMSRLPGAALPGAVELV